MIGLRCSKQTKNTARFKRSIWSMSMEQGKNGGEVPWSCQSLKDKHMIPRHVYLHLIDRFLDESTISLLFQLVCKYLCLFYELILQLQIIWFKLKCMALNSVAIDLWVNIWNIQNKNIRNKFKKKYLSKKHFLITKISHLFQGMQLG